MNHSPTKHRHHAAFLALSLFWGCATGELQHRAATTDAGTLPSASDAATDASPCAPGSAGPQCGPCPAGSYCPGGTTPMALCGVNEYDADQDPKTACVAASSCPAGTYVALLYSRVTDQRCAPCPSGTFSEQPNTRSCSLFRECDDAQFELQSPSSQRDRQCAACAQCKPGQHVSTQPTSSTDRGCSACDAGFFSSTYNASACQRWRVCAANEREIAAPSSTRDRTCVVREACDAEQDDAGCLNP
jgi:hypothetical protein